MRRILTRELRPGDAISVRSVASELGVGITPARDALLALRHEGLIEVKPNVGSVVRMLTPGEIKARYELRLAIETVALRWAAENMTPAARRRLLELCDEQEALTRAGDHQARFDRDMKFHRLLIGTGGNREISRAAKHLRILESTYPMGVGRPTEQLLSFIDEHRQIVGHLSKGEVDKAQAVLDTHLTRPVPEAQARSEELSLAMAEIGE